jgi:peptidoglycan/LPS O-acetylase OafA/YrhL
MSLELKTPKISATSWRSYDEFKSMNQFAGFDGIRALAVVGTIIAHSPNGQIWNMLNGQAGVIVFFVLSGFLITTLALREEERYGIFNFRAFIIRRSFRLFPVYYAVLGLYCILILWFKVPTSSTPTEFKSSLPYLIFYMQEYTHLDNYYQTWSLGIEEKFYIFWPLVAFVVFHKSGQRWLWAFISSVFIILLLTVNWPRIGHLPYFALLSGAFTAVLLNSRALYGKVTHVLGRAWVPCVSGLVICHFLSVSYPVLLWLSCLFMCLNLMLIVSGAFPKVVSMLEHPKLARLGVYSYGVYLIHLLAKAVVVKIQPHSAYVRFDSFVSIILTTILSYACAAVSFKYFERPLTRLGRGISDRVMGNRG